MRSEIENSIRTAADNDPDFRTALIADPAAAVREQFGVEIPDGFTLRVVQESPTEVILVLPSDRSTVILAESDLDSAAGAGYATGHSNCY